MQKRWFFSKSPDKSPDLGIAANSSKSGLNRLYYFFTKYRFTKEIFHENGFSAFFFRKKYENLILDKSSQIKAPLKLLTIWADQSDTEIDDSPIECLPEELHSTGKQNNDLISKVKP